VGHFCAPFPQDFAGLTCHGRDNSLPNWVVNVPPWQSFYSRQVFNLYWQAPAAGTFKVYSMLAAHFILILG
jgi:hypothetical protein